MWDEEGLFKVLAPSTVKHDEIIPNYPESVNQLARLEILNVLAVMKYPHAQSAIRTFLKEKAWGITGMASVVLLTEGDEAAIELVRELLNDPDQKIRVQAALVLSLWGEGEEAISILKEAYPTADRDMKERILESFGRIGAKSSLPFLTEKLQEPYQSLRIIAAAALLQCLYH
jgi:HEAT repeat protein